MVPVVINIAHELLQIAIKEVAFELKRETKDRGHSNTGKLIDSIEVVIRKDSIGGFTGTIFWNDYGSILDAGVRPNRIPFSLGSGKRSSKYIDGLFSFFRSRGLGEKEAKGAAFATAIVHKREGMSTKKSRGFSSSGKRNGMAKAAVESMDKKIGVYFNQIYTITITNRVVDLLVN